MTALFGVKWVRALTRVLALLFRRRFDVRLSMWLVVSYLCRMVVSLLCACLGRCRVRYRYAARTALVLLDLTVLFLSVKLTCWRWVLWKRLCRISVLISWLLWSVLNPLF